MKYDCSDCSTHESESDRSACCSHCKPGSWCTGGLCHGTNIQCEKPIHTMNCATFTGPKAAKCCGDLATGSWCTGTHCASLPKGSYAPCGNPHLAPSPPPIPTNRSAYQECPSPVTKQTNRGTLFLYPESNGFHILDFGGFPNPWLMINFFKNIAVVANMSAGHSEVLGQWQTVNNVFKPFAAAGGNIELWLSIYFGPDDTQMCHVNTQGCGSWTPPTKNALYHPTQKEQQDVVTAIQQMIQWARTATGVQVAGIVFDNEVGNPMYIVPALEKAVSGTDIKLAWTKEVTSAKNRNTPSNVSGKSWDYMLGQAYTDIWGYCSPGDASCDSRWSSTKRYYEKPSKGESGGGCGFINPTEFWAEIKHDMYYSGTGTESQVRPPVHPVPLLCGGGDCQQIPAAGDGDPGTCYDQRAKGSQLTTLLCARPDDPLLADFGIWWGEYPGHISHCSLTRQSGTCTDDSACVQYGPNWYCLPDDKGANSCTQSRCCSVPCEDKDECAKGCCTKWQWQAVELPANPGPHLCTGTHMPDGCPCNHKSECSSSFCNGRCMTPDVCP